MTFVDLYLICFLLGTGLCLVSLLLGNLHVHLHLPFHLHFDGFHATHVAHAPHIAHAGAGHAHGSGQMSVINFGTVAAFLTWFGGAGYLLTKYSGLVGILALLLAVGVGLIGASIVFFLVVKVMLKYDVSMDPSDYDMVGVLGRVTSSIRESGTGELVYVQDETRHACGARSLDGRAIAKGVEVVVTKFEKGIAYVTPWEELTDSGVDVSNIDSER